MLFQIRVGALSFEWGMLRTQHQWTWLHGSVLACKTTIPESGEGSSSRLKVLFSCHIMGGSMALQPRQQGRKHLINVPRSERQTSRAVPSHSGGTPKHRSHQGPATHEKSRTEKKAFEEWHGWRVWKDNFPQQSRNADSMQSDLLPRTWRGWCRLSAVIAITHCTLTLPRNVSGCMCVREREAKVNTRSVWVFTLRTFFKGASLLLTQSISLSKRCWPASGGCVWWAAEPARTYVLGADQQELPPPDSVLRKRVNQGPTHACSLLVTYSHH